MSLEMTRQEDLFAEALGKEPGAAREAWLDEACGQDVDLRRRLGELLVAHEAAGDFLPLPASDVTTNSLPPMEAVGETVGHYKLLEQIGEGGFGVVYLAEQRESIRRRVALKILKPGMDTRQVVARFEAERQALALMDHANIAKVFDAGATAAGRPFFVMELVKGIAITDYCNQCNLTTPERLRLFIAVCQAVQHAHQKGVIHRDIKPSNVLVAVPEGQPTVKVIDFGVAKAINQRLTEDSLHTGFAQMIGTPLYMSPEQAEMSPLDIDTRGDIYSLGVLLYELLTGTTPFTRERFRQASFDELRRIIREEEPPTPSSRLSTLNAEAASSVARLRRTEPRRLIRSVRGDLDWIVMKCLEKDRTRRYDTAAGLAQDIEHYLANEPVLARPPSRSYRVRKFARRNGLALSAGIAVMTALVIGTGVSTWQAVVASRARAEAEIGWQQTLEALRSATDDVIGRLIGSRPELGQSEREFLEAALKRWQALAEIQGTSELALRIRGEGTGRVGELQRRLGHSDAALANYRASIGHYRQLNLQYPGVPEYERGLARCLLNLGVLEYGFGAYDAARENTDAAIDILERTRKSHAYEPNAEQLLAACYNNLAALSSLSGDSSSARTVQEAARDIQRDLANRYPNTPRFQKDLAASCMNIGSLLLELREFDGALDGFQEAQNIQRRLVELYPNDPDYRHDLAATLYGLGNLLDQQQNQSRARAVFQEACDIQRELVKQFPALVEYEELLAKSYCRLGDMHTYLLDYDEARAAITSAIELQLKLSRRFPDVRAHREGLAGSYISLGSYFGDTGSHAEALKNFNLALEAVTPIDRGGSPSAQALELMRRAYSSRATAYERDGQYEKSLDDWQKAIDLTPLAGKAEAHSFRAVTQAKAGRIAAVLAEIESLQDMSSRDRLVAFNIARVYSIAGRDGSEKQREYSDRAVAHLRTAVQAGYHDFLRLKTDHDFDSLRGRADFQQLMDDLEAASARAAAPKSDEIGEKP